MEANNIERAEKVRKTPIKETSHQQHQTRLDQSSIVEEDTPSNTSRGRRFRHRPAYRAWVRKMSKRDLISGTQHLNLSKHKFTKTQEEVLDLGPNWCSLPRKYDKVGVMASMDRWDRSMEWVEYWASEKRKATVLDGFGFVSDSDEEDEPEPPANRVLKDRKIKTNRPTRHNKPAALGDFIAAVKSSVLSAPLKPAKTNMNPARDAAVNDLNDLQRDEDGIVIRPSDKNGGFVSLDRAPYKAELDSQLTETFIDDDGVEKCKYVPTTQAQLKREYKIIEELIEEGRENGWISDADAKVALGPEPKCGRFSGYPKDHKPVDPVTGIPPIRAVISTCGSNTEGLSKIVDDHIAPVEKELPSYIQDTPHLLRDFDELNEEGPQTEDTILVSLDVVALYPNTPQEEGLRALAEALREAGMDEKLIDFLIRCTRVVLTCNSFEWVEKLFTQVFGTAIGTPLAKSFCSIFMGKFEREALEDWAKLELANIKFYKRFVDDLFFLFRGTKEELLIFIAFLNARHRHIKFTAQFDIENRRVDFLDLTVRIDEHGFIQTTIFRKPNVRNGLLRYESCHPAHCTKNIPRNICHRIVRNCSIKEEREEALDEVASRLQERGYPSSLVKAAIKWGKELDRKETLKKVFRQRGTEKTVNCVIRYDPRNPDTAHIMRRHYNIMVERDSRMKNVFPNCPRISYTRPRNLKEILCSTKLPRVRKNIMTRKPKPGFKRCATKTCGMCPYTPGASGGNRLITEVKIKHSGQVIPIKEQLNCDTKNCLYLCTCEASAQSCVCAGNRGKKARKYKGQYAGQTERKVKERWAEHKRSMEDPNTKKTVGMHFQEKGHKGPEDCTIVPFMKIRSKDPFVRLLMEKKAISDYGLIESGLNKKLG